MERHEKTVELPHLTPFAKRIAIVVATLAALLAISEVFAENRIAHVITDETKIAHKSTTLEVDEIKRALGKEAAPHAEVRAEIAHLETDQSSSKTAHTRLEFAIILLQVGIVLSSVSALIGAKWLLRGGTVLGLLGGGFLVAGLLA
jgi:thymidine phosphorylase